MSALPRITRSHSPSLNTFPKISSPKASQSAKQQKTIKNETSMSSDPILNDDVRAKIMSAPETLLEDKDIMRALVAADEQNAGENVVDLRGIAMERLEARLDRLEDCLLYTSPSPRDRG